MTAVALGEKVYLDHAVMESDRFPSVSTFIHKPEAAIGVHKPQWNTPLQGRAPNIHYMGKENDQYTPDSTNPAPKST